MKKQIDAEMAKRLAEARAMEIAEKRKTLRDLLKGIPKWSALWSWQRSVDFKECHAKATLALNNARATVGDLDSHIIKMSEFQ